MMTNYSNPSEKDGVKKFSVNSEQEVTASNLPGRDRRTEPSEEPCKEIRFNAIISQKNLLFNHVDEFLKKMPLDSPNNNIAEITEENKKIIDGHQLRKAIEDFREFFDDYFKFFENGDKREYQKRMSCECVLSTALSQIRSIWTCLSWAVNQRFIDIYEEKLKDLNESAKQLMDLAPELFLSKMERRRPIIYFDKSVHIRRYTYPTSPLIGVSIDKTPEEWRLSLAHELGHYVFWNSGNLQEYAENIDSIHDIIFSELSFDEVDHSDHKKVIRSTRIKLEMFEILKGWSEEIMADIFATLLVGPEYVKSCQDILARDSISNTDDYIKNDGKHPIPKLRPFVSLEVLRVIAKKKQEKAGDDVFVGKLNEVVDKLDKRWENFATSNTDTHLKNMPDCEIDELKKCLLNIVNKITLSSKGMPAKHKSFIEYVPCHWGAGDNSEKEIADLKNVIQSLQNDFLGKTPSPSTKKANSEPDDVEPDDDKYHESFKNFFKYVQGQKTENPVWEDMLLINLTQTDYLYCRAYDSQWNYIGGCKCQ